MEIVTINDLNGMTQTKLENISGIGPETARKAMRIIKAAGGVYRGEGFPWEITLNVSIPDEGRYATRNLAG